MFSLKNRGKLPSSTAHEFENLISQLKRLWLTEHNEDGTHNSDAATVGVSLDSEDTTGVLPVVNGGTGLSEVTAGKGLYGNDTDALQTTNFKYVPVGSNTLSDAVADMSNGDVLVLDTGTYTQTVSVAIPAGITSFAIVGQGQGVSIINYTISDVHGITSSGIGSGNANRITNCLLANFSMQYSVGTLTSTKCAIQLWGYDYENVASVGIRIENVGISYGSVNNCWFTGIRIVNARVCVLDQIYIRRQANGRSGVGILLESCMNCRISNSWIMSVGKAFHLSKADDSLIISTVKHGCEDITISNSSCYIVGYGAYLDYKCFSAKLFGVEFSRPSFGAIFEDITSGAANGGYHLVANCYTDIDSNTIASSSLFLFLRPGTSVRGCQFTMADADTSATRDINAVVFSSSANLCSVENCLFRNAGGTVGAQGIWMNTNACIAIGNRFENSTGAGNDILVSGTNNAAVNNMYDTTISNTGGGTNTITPNYLH
jgi:hypothetical protein